MLRITSLNLNGIRSAYNKGLLDWLRTHQADILCLQELKAHLADIHDDLQHPLDYTGHFCAAEKKGYSGVGIYLRKEPERILRGMDCPEFDTEGRINCLLDILSKMDVNTGLLSEKSRDLVEKWRKSQDDTTPDPT